MTDVTFFESAGLPKDRNSLTSVPARIAVNGRTLARRQLLLPVTGLPVMMGRRLNSLACATGLLRLRAKRARMGAE